MAPPETPGTVAGSFAQRLDDDLLLAQQFVDEQAAASCAVLHEHQQRLARVVVCRA